MDERGQIHVAGAVDHRTEHLGIEARIFVVGPLFDQPFSSQRQAGVGVNRNLFRLLVYDTVGLS